MSSYNYPKKSADTKPIGTAVSGKLQCFIVLGLRDTEATNALLINSSIPVWIVLFGVIFYGDSLTTRRGLGITISLAGVSF